MQQVDQILEEIRQLQEQYKKEVPTGRRAWPQSIKQRVCELRELGISFRKIAHQTGISVVTMYAWNQQKSQKEAKFIPVEVVNTKKTITVTDTDNSMTDIKKTVTVTVTTPQGFKIDGLDIEQVLLVIGRLEK
jgi:hypothetical protein